MKDYSNYRLSTYDKIYWSNKQVFNNELKYKGDDVLVDKTSIRAVIKEHSNPFNEKKEERKFLCNLEVNIKRGSIVFYDNRNWLVISEIDSNKVYKSCKILQCNNVIKFYDKTSILNTIVSVPCIKENKSMGIDDNKYFINVKGKITIKVPVSDKTLQIYDGQHFIIDLYVYEVDEIKFIDLNLDKMSGYLEIEMSKVQEDERDNFETGIAWNKNDVKNSYKITVLNGENLSTKVSDSTQLNVQVLNNNEIISPTPELTYISSNESICTVNNQGLINSLQVGECTIAISLKSESNIKSIVNIKVEDVIQDNKTVVISGSNKIYKNKSAIYNCSFLNNGVIYKEKSEFYLMQEDGITPLNSDIAYISSQDADLNQCIVQTKTFSGVKNIKLFVKSSDGIIVSKSFDIKICSLI